MSRRVSRRGEEARRRMVQRLERQGIRDSRVLEAMGRVPRELFVPEGLRGRAYGDEPLPIGFGQTISQPWTVARLSELLRVQPLGKVLEVGSGSGYQAAVLAEMGIRVFSLERQAALARRSASLLLDLGYLRATVKHFDGTYGWAAQAPFDGVVVTAGGPEVPRTLVEQLEVGGRLVLPLARSAAQRLVVVTRTRNGTREEDHGSASFVPLVGRFGYPQAPEA